jgi:FlaA1/EpsC-like NDP-sugar epimerase
MKTEKSSHWKAKKVFITGVCGTVGKQILSILAKEEKIEIIGIDINESELFFLKDVYREKENLSFYYCDIRDLKDMYRLAKESHYVIHTAALKHVDICEYSPFDAIKTNVLGTQSIIDLAEKIQCERVLFTSTDKAVNPTNVMGTSKLMAERLMSSANFRNKGKPPIYISTRFGNVLGSRGSVIPLFKKQIRDGGPVTLTDTKMTRFIMTLEEASHLVLESLLLGNGGEVFVTKMPIINIIDLAEIMVEILAPKYGYDPKKIKIKTIGKRPGEKIYEELTNDEEIRRTIEMEKYLCIIPSTSKYSLEEKSKKYSNVTSYHVTNPYNSSIEKKMTKAELRKYLLTKNLV